MSRQRIRRLLVLGLIACGFVAGLVWTIKSLGTTLSRPTVAAAPTNDAPSSSAVQLQVPPEAQVLPTEHNPPIEADEMLTCADLLGAAGDSSVKQAAETYAAFPSQDPTPAMLAKLARYFSSSSSFYRVTRESWEATTDPVWRSQSAKAVTCNVGQRRGSLLETFVDVDLVSSGQYGTRTDRVKYRVLTYLLPSGYQMAGIYGEGTGPQLGGSP